MKKGLLHFVDFQEYGDFNYQENTSTIFCTTCKKASPCKKYFFKIFKFECKNPKDQKIVLETFYQISNMKNQYTLSYKHISFSFGTNLTPTFSMKYISSKTLQSVLDTPSIFSTWKIADIMECLFAVTEGMNYLHNHLIYHGNLCPANIIIDKANQFYVCDFGLYPIKKLYVENEFIFNNDYKDPYMNNNEPTFKNDVYSFGVLMCHLFHSYYQMRNGEQTETLEEFLINNNRNKYNKFPRFCSELIPACLNSFVSERPSFKQILDLFKSTIFDDEELSISKLYEKFASTNYLKGLALTNDSFALIKLGNMYEKGIVFKRDHAQAMNYYKRAAELNNSEAQNICGVLLQYNEEERTPKELKEGAKYLQRSAEQGNIHGMANYGVALLYGHGVTRSIQKAEEYLKKSADLGFSYAQVNYGFTLLDNNPTLSGISEGLQYIKKSMSQQDPDAYYTYAVLLQKGQYVEKSDELAMEYFKISANLGDDRAMMEYAEGNLKGIGVPQNKEIAIKYYQLAADNGNRDAKEIVAELSKTRQEIEIMPKQSKIKTKKTFRKRQTETAQIKNDLIEREITSSQSEPNSSQPIDQDSASKKIKVTKEQTPKRTSKKEAIPNQQAPLDTISNQIINQDSNSNDLTSSNKEAKKGKSTAKKQATLTNDETTSKKATRKTSTKSKNKLDQPFLAQLAKTTSTNDIQKVNDDIYRSASSPPSTQFPTSTSKSFGFSKNPVNSTLPLQVSPKIKLISLGSIVYDKPNYHTDKYIYPVGYQIEKEFFSIDDPSKQAVYRATVLNGGENPIFRVECLDRTNMVFEGNTPSKPWVDATQAIEESKKRMGMQQRGSFAISGPKYFGFSLRNVMQMVESLPNAEKCTNYKINKHPISSCVFDEKQVVSKEEEDSNEISNKLQKSNPLNDEKIILKSHQFNSEKQKQQQPNINLPYANSDSFNNINQQQQQNPILPRDNSDSINNINQKQQQQQQQQNRSGAISNVQDMAQIIREQYENLLSVKTDPIGNIRQVPNIQIKQDQIIALQQMMQNMPAVKQEPVSTARKQQNKNKKNVQQNQQVEFNSAQQQQQYQNLLNAQMQQVKAGAASNVQQQQQTQQYQNVSNAQINMTQVKSGAISNVQQQQQQQQQQFQNMAGSQFNFPQIKPGAISNLQPQQYQSSSNEQSTQQVVGKKEQIVSIQQQQPQQYQNIAHAQTNPPQTVTSTQQQFQSISNVQVNQPQEKPVQLNNDQQYQILSHVQINPAQSKPLQFTNDQIQILAHFQNFLQAQRQQTTINQVQQNVQQQTTINQVQQNVQQQTTINQVQQNDKSTAQENQVNQNNMLDYIFKMMNQQMK